MDSTNISVEKKIRTAGPWEIIKKLRVQAAERGIPPVDIDRKLLQGEFGNLDSEVRAILESQISGAKGVEVKEVVMDTPERTAGVSKQVKAKTPGVDRVDIGGLNVVDKMKQLAKEVGAKETGKENVMADESQET
ncbi:MAG: hypothetical protein U9Q67_00665, partial [Patescibacteria group bacterium]|nr:hypothetical protein [Patescibacteria group bacterium]